MDQIAFGHGAFLFLHGADARLTASFRDPTAAFSILTAEFICPTASRYQYLKCDQNRYLTKLTSIRT